MNILFVCTGNTCRSPMAEGYLNSLRLNKVKAYSAGFSFSGDNANEKSIAVMSEIGVDITAHRSKTVSPVHIENADKIICMSPSHRQILEKMGVEKEISVLDGGIPDPYGCDISVYRECRERIVSSINKLFSINQPDVFTVENETEFDGIEKIEKQCFSSPWSKASLIESFRAKTDFFVCKKNGKAVGYMGISTVLDEGYVTNIAVLEKERNKGIASAVLKKAIASALEKGLSFVSLEVRKSNKAAISLYERFGFKQEGIRCDFYTLPKEDALIMTRRF